MTDEDVIQNLINASSIGSSAARALRLKSSEAVTKRVSARSFLQHQLSDRSETIAWYNQGTRGGKYMSTNTINYLAGVQLGSFLEAICQAIELTPSQFKDAEDKYTAVASWLSDSSDPLLAGLHIYPQGSAALGTTIRPLTHAEFDIDLVAHFPGLHLDALPQRVKAAIGLRLREHAVYARMLEEKPRCWRLNYAGEFHMDLTPSIPNPGCGNGGELVPDKPQNAWKASNPRGYQEWFQKIAALAPPVRTPAGFTEALRAQIEAIPAQTPLKGALRRTVQLLKRHRDEFFQGPRLELAPISIVITTLAARSYEYYAANETFDSEFDLVHRVVAGLPGAIEITQESGRTVFVLKNPTTAGENFCEKWNVRPELAEAFFQWQQAATEDFGAMLQRRGIDSIRHELVRSFGAGPVDAALGQFRTAVQHSRSSGSLAVGATGLLTTTAPGAVRAPKNTHFGVA